MAYQASKSSCKEVVVKAYEIKEILCWVVLVCTTSLIFSLPAIAQTTTNPLTEEVSITATVLQGPGVYPDTPASSPSGPVNMTDSLDVVIFKGQAYPGSVISLLKNGVVVAGIPANPNGTFEIRVRNLNSGIYSFGLRAEDQDGLKSKLLQFTIFVSSPVTTIVDGIFIPPTITSDKVEVKKRNPIIFSGKSSPNSEVRLSIYQDYSDIEFLKKTTANTMGSWSYILDTADFLYGDYSAKARSLTVNDLSPYSDPISFRISDTDRLRAKASALNGFVKRCDLNNDDRVNLLDFSIMAFWYKRLGFPDRVDLNSDTRINLTDLSILAYCWTG